MNATRRESRRRWLAAGLSVVMLTVWACTNSSTLSPSAPDIASTEPLGPPFFKDVTGASGIDTRYRNGEEAGHLAILESLGGGIVLIDYDGDGLLDVFVPGGGYYDGPDKKTIQ